MEGRGHMDTLERTTTVNWAFRREIGNALGYMPHPDYDWAWLDDDNVHEYPAWDVDLNAAIKLATDEHMSVRISPQMDGSFYVFIEFSLLEWEGHAPTLPEAVCLAWLAYKNDTTADDY